MLRRAWTCVSPRPNTFITSRQTTAIPSATMCLPPKNHCGFEDDDAADAHQAGQSDHKEHDHRDACHNLPRQNDSARRQIVQEADRKSTRLNSSHANISYAVFCLKKKKTNVQLVR